MKKSLICFLTSVLLSAVLTGHASAQSPVAKYRGEVSLGYTFNVNEECSYMRLEVLNGAQITRYFFTGIGIEAEKCTEDEPLFFPVYAHFRGILPVGNTVALFVGTDLGTKFDYSYGTSGGFLFRPEFGVDFSLGKRYGLAVALKYEYYSCTENFSLYGIGLSAQVKNNGIGLRVGFRF